MAQPKARSDCFISLRASVVLKFPKLMKGSVGLETRFVGQYLLSEMQIGRLSVSNQRRIRRVSLHRLT